MNAHPVEQFSDESILSRMISKFRRDPKFRAEVEKEVDAERAEIRARRVVLQQELENAKNLEQTDSVWSELKAKIEQVDAAMKEWNFAHPGSPNADLQKEWWELRNSLTKRGEAQRAVIRRIELELAAMPPDPAHERALAVIDEGQKTLAMRWEEAKRLDREEQHRLFDRTSVYGDANGVRVLVSCQSYTPTVKFYSRKMYGPHSLPVRMAALRGLNLTAEQAKKKVDEILNELPPLEPVAMVRSKKNGTMVIAR